MSIGRVLFVLAALCFILAATGTAALAHLALVPLGLFLVAIGLAVG